MEELQREISRIKERGIIDVKNPLTLSMLKTNIFINTLSQWDANGKPENEQKKICTDYKDLITTFNKEAKENFNQRREEIMLYSPLMIALGSKDKSNCIVSECVNDSICNKSDTNKFGIGVKNDTMCYCDLGIKDSNSQKQYNAIEKYFL